MLLARLEIGTWAEVRLGLDQSAAHSIPYAAPTTPTSVYTCITRDVHGDNIVSKEKLILPRTRQRLLVPANT